MTRNSNTAQVAAIDKALTLCGGSFIAAGKLLDLCPASFRGIVFCTPYLKSRWGRTKRGPGRRIGFRIEAYQGNREFGSLYCIQKLIEALRATEKRELLDWLRAHCSETG